MKIGTFDLFSLRNVVRRSDRVAIGVVRATKDTLREHVQK